MSAATSNGLPPSGVRRDGFRSKHRRLLNVVGLLLALCTADGRCAEPVHSVFALQFSPDGELLAGASNSMEPPGPVVLWNVSDWSVVHVHRPRAGSLHVDFSPDGGRLAYAGKDGTVGIIDVASGGLVREIEAHAGAVYSVDFAPDGETLVSGGNDGKIQLWNARTGERIATFEGHTKAVGAAISPDGTRLLSGGQDKTARLWDLASREVLMTFEPSELIVRRMTFSRDGSHFLTSRYDGKVRIRETKTGRLVARLASGSQCADISADNRLVATSGWGATAYVYRVQLRAATRDEQGQIAALLSRFADDSYAVRMSALAEIEKFGMIAEPQLREAMRAEDAELRVRARQLRERVLSPEPIAHLGGHRGDVEVVCFSPDSRLLATACRGGDIKVWPTSNFQDPVTLQIRTDN